MSAKRVSSASRRARTSPPFAHTFVIAKLAANRSVEYGGSGIFTASRPSKASSGTPNTSCAISRRSEEHPSELQSLMRISYAVFCLNKNTYHHICSHRSRRYLIYHSDEHNGDT